MSNDLKYDAMRCVIRLCDDSTFDLSQSVFTLPDCLFRTFHNVISMSCHEE